MTCNVSSGTLNPTILYYTFWGRTVSLVDWQRSSGGDMTVSSDYMMTSLKTLCKEIYLIKDFEKSSSN